MGTILIGVDASERSEDAIAFGRRLAEAAEATAIVASAYPYASLPTVAAGDAALHTALREEALATVRTMREGLELPEDRAPLRVTADPSPPKALHELAHAEHASLLVVGSSHTGRAGRVLPGSTAERLLHGAPCSVAVVPKDYRRHEPAAIRRIGVAFDGGAEAQAAVAAAVALARALGAGIDVIGVVSTDYLTTPALLGASGVETLLADAEQAVQESLDAAVAGIPEGIPARAVRATGDAAIELAKRSEELDVLVIGSRGYGPLRSVLAGGVSGRVLRGAHCPVIVVPRGIEAPLDSLFAKTAAA